MYTAGALLTSRPLDTLSVAKGAMRGDPIEQLVLQVMGADAAERVPQGRHQLSLPLESQHTASPTRFLACLAASLVRRRPRIWASKDCDIDNT